MAEVKDNKVLKAKRVTFSFPFVHTMRPPMKGTDGKPKYECTAILDPNDPANKATIGEIVTEVRRLAAANGVDEALVKKVFNGEDSSKFFLCCGKGENKKDKDNKTLKGYEGKFFVTARSETQPAVVDHDMNDLTAASGKPYGGARGNMNFDLYFWTKAGKSGVSAGLRAVQMTGRGVAFGRAPVNAKEEFERMESEDGEATATAGATSDDGFMD